MSTEFHPCLELEMALNDEACLSLDPEVLAAKVGLEIDEVRLGERVEIDFSHNIELVWTPVNLPDESFDSWERDIRAKVADDAVVLVRIHCPWAGCGRMHWDVLRALVKMFAFPDDDWNDGLSSAVAGPVRIGGQFCSLDNALAFLDQEWSLAVISRLRGWPGSYRLQHVEDSVVGQYARRYLLGSSDADRLVFLWEGDPNAERYQPPEVLLSRVEALLQAESSIRVAEVTDGAGSIFIYKLPTCGADGAVRWELRRFSGGLRAQQSFRVECHDGLWVLSDQKNWPWNPHGGFLPCLEKTLAQRDLLVCGLSFLGDDSFLACQQGGEYERSPEDEELFRLAEEWLVANGVSLPSPLVSLELDRACGHDAEGNQYDLSDVALRDSLENVLCRRLEQQVLAVCGEDAQLIGLNLGSPKDKRHFYWSNSYFRVGREGLEKLLQATQRHSMVVFDLAPGLSDESIKVALEQYHESDDMSQLLTALGANVRIFFHDDWVDWIGFGSPEGMTDYLRQRFLAAAADVVEPGASLSVESGESMKVLESFSTGSELSVEIEPREVLPGVWEVAALEDEKGQRKTLCALKSEGQETCVVFS